jgi:hypothetical protein
MTRTPRGLPARRFVKPMDSFSNAFAAATAFIVILRGDAL